MPRKPKNQEASPEPEPEEPPVAFQTQAEWIAACGVPMPDHKLLSDVSDLGGLLQTFGGYIAYLEGQLGLLAGRSSALRAAYNTAMAIRTADITEGSEKSKEAQILADETNEDLRKTKRFWIETDMIYETAKGMCAAYTKAWETASRLLTLRNAELETMPRRTP